MQQAPAAICAHGSAPLADPNALACTFNSKSSAVGREKAIPKKSGSPKSCPTTPKAFPTQAMHSECAGASSPNARIQAAPGEFGPACGEQTHALARTAAAKPGAACIRALGELAPAHSLCIACFGKAFGVVGQLLGEPDFFGIAFSRPTAQSAFCPVLLSRFFPLEMPFLFGFNSYRLRVNKLELEMPFTASILIVSE